MNENKKAVSMDKQYKTRDRRDVRVLCVDADSVYYPVIALVNNISPVTYSINGEHDIGTESPLDLIEQQEEKTVWLEIYRYSTWDISESNVCNLYNSYEELERNMCKSYKGYHNIAIKKITYVAGDRE
jgi:hypothetical protein